MTKSHLALIVPVSVAFALLSASAMAQVGKIGTMKDTPDPCLQSGGGKPCGGAAPPEKTPQGSKQNCDPLYGCEINKGSEAISQGYLSHQKGSGGDKK